MPPRSIFITGASSGLGRGLALHYAKDGATVHAAARRAQEIEILAREAPPGHVVPVVLSETWYFPIVPLLPLVCLGR